MELVVPGIGRGVLKIKNAKRKWIIILTEEVLLWLKSYQVGLYKL